MNTELYLWYNTNEFFVGFKDVEFIQIRVF